MTTRLNVNTFKSTSNRSSDNPTELTRSDVDDVVRTLLGNNAYTILDNIEGEDKFGTAPRMNGRFKSSLIDLETVVAYS